MKRSTEKDANAVLAGLEKIRADARAPYAAAIKRRDAALALFCDTIEATGGVRTDRKGFTVPCADEEWLDLGAAYIAACWALGRKPMRADEVDLT